MSAVYQIKCNHGPCTMANDINNVVCDGCGKPIAEPITIRRASIESEIDALSKRYADAISFLSSNSLTSEGKDLEQVVINDGRAVINSPFDYVYAWLTNSTKEYTSYKRQILNNDRKQALFDNDKNRCTVDAILFGSHIDIVYAALTIDDSGVISYGDTYLFLKPALVESRTSCLERNSFFFVTDIEAKGWRWNQPIPPGYMSTWQSKEKLTIAKVHKQLFTSIAKSDMAKLVLHSDGDRTKDEFIELFISGNISQHVIERIRFPNAKVTVLSPLQLIRLDELKKKYTVEFY